MFHADNLSPYYRIVTSVMKPKICVIIPNWNGKDVILHALRSLQHQTLPHHVIVVDNGSEDDSVETIKRRFPRVEIIALAKNHGFTGGVNIGIRKALKDKFSFIALLNNDAVVDRHWLKTLVRVLKERPDVMIATGKLLRNDHKHFDSCGEFIRQSGMPFPRGRDETDRGQFDQAGYVFAASGGASLYRSLLFQEIGLFDEDFFAYFEDVDISWRARLAGHKIWYAPQAVGYHRVGHTSRQLSGFTRYHSVKNYIMLYNKNMPGGLFWTRKPLLFWQLLRMLFGSIRDHQLGSFARAIMWGLWHTPQTLHKRRRIQKNRTVAPTEIKDWMRAL